MQQALTFSERLIAVLGARLGLRFFRRRDMLETLDAPAHGHEAPPGLLDAARDAGPDLLARLHTTRDGLSDDEAATVRAHVGVNEVEHEKPLPWWRHLFNCYRNPFNLLLSALAAVSYATDDTEGTIIIASMVIISTVLRFVQEARSSKAAEKLKAMVSTTATVLRREVFGHEAGSFTGALKRRIGKLEYAQAGTLFLDEIETMQMALQVKFLRVLQERQFERIGSNELLPMNCRIIAATKADLLELARQQRFRDDLYYRLGVIVLEIPSLRERREDIPLLFEHFVLRAAAAYGRPVPEIGAERLNRLMARPWPGNVRELCNVAERFTLGLGTGDPDDGPQGTPRTLDEQMNLFERRFIEEALRASGGRASLACEKLGIPRKTLYDKMRRLGIASDDFK